MKLSARHFGTFALLFALLLAAALSVHAQSSTSADMEGVVTDAAGGVIPGAELVVTNAATGVTRTSTTNNLGRYRVAALPAGEYTLRISKAGFAVIERKGLILQVGQVATIDAQMSVAVQAQTVSVTESAPIIETGTAAVGAVVTQNDIDNLPINGRDFLDFARTVAGVTAQQTGGQGSGISFHGQRQRSNNLSVDGADNNGALNGNTRLTMSQEAVREFQVVTNQYAPEFGRAGGGFINVVSKSGTNDFHGNVLAFIRDEAMDGRNAFSTDAEKPKFKRKNLGATLGGPLVENKTFFFSSVEYMSRHESGQVTIADDAVRAINSVLAQNPIPRGGVRSIMNGTYPVDRIRTLASLKVDHNINENNSLMFRYIYGQDREANAGGVSIGGLTDVSGGGGQRDRDQSFLVGWNRVFSPTFMSETRFQYAPRKLMQYANDMTGPRVSISGVATFGRSTSFPVLLDETTYQVQQAFSKQAGRHYFKFGADINYLRANTSYPNTFAGSFSFPSLADFVAGRPGSFSQGFGDPKMMLPEKMIGFYAQDAFKVNEKLTFTYGVRYDYDMQPQGIARDPNNPITATAQTGINRDPNNWAPRFGFNFNPDGKGKTVLRGGYGIFYDKIFLLVARNSLIARQTLSLNTQALATAQWPKGAFPESSSFPSGVTLPKPSLNRTDPNLRIPYAQQWSFGIEREVARDWAVGLDYVGVRGVKLLRSQNINLAPPVKLTAENGASLGVSKPNAQQLGRMYYGSASRLNPDYTNVQYVSSSASSTYHGAQLSIQKRFSAGFQFRANYTFSKAIDDTSDFTQAMQPSNPYYARGERSLSLEDQRHRFTLSGVWELPYKSAGNKSAARALFGDWVLSTNWTFRSGTPYNITVGSDVNGDGNSSTDRPWNGAYELGRNTLTGPESRNIDVRLSKRVYIRERVNIQILAEAFNLQNRVNFSDVNTTWGTALEPRATLGQYVSASSPRQLQLGIKVGF